MLDLNSDARPRGVPVPRWIFDVTGDLDRLGPCPAVIATVADPNRARMARSLGLDCRLIIRPAIVGQQKPKHAGFLVRDSAGIAARVRPVVPDDALRAPGLAAI